MIDPFFHRDSFSRQRNIATFRDPVPLKVELRGFRNGDTSTFTFQAQSRTLSGQARWFVEVNLFSQSISNELRVSAVGIYGNYTGGWILSNAEAGDIYFPAGSPAIGLPTQPVFNKNWQIISQQAATQGPGPVVELHFTLSC